MMERDASSTWGWHKLRKFLLARVDRGSEVGLRLTIGVVVFAAAIWVLGGLLEDVLERESLVRWDIAVHAWLYDHTVPAGLSICRIITQFGSSALYAVMLLVALLLAMQRQRFMLWSWISINVGGALVEFVLKASVQRQRPEFSAAHIHRESYSFPSGHAMMSLICYVTLAYVLSSLGRWSHSQRNIAFVIAIVWSLIIAFSRLYLGVHYPSDVFGGLAAAVAWLAASLTTMHFVQRRET